MLHEKSLVIAFKIRLYQAFYVVFLIFYKGTKQKLSCAPALLRMLVAGGLDVLSYSTLILDKIEAIYLLVLASFLNTLHVTYRFVAFYQIGQACFSHDTSLPLPYL